MQKKVKVFVPIRGPEFDASLNENYEKLLGDFEHMGNNKILIHLIDYGEDPFNSIIELKIKVIYSSKFYNEENEEIKSFAKKFSFFHNEWISEFLEISFTLKRFHQQIGEIIINNILSRFSLIIHLAYNLKIDFLPGIIFNANNTKRLIGKTEFIMNNLDLAYLHALNMKWPIIKQPTFEQTINWFQSNNFHPSNISQSKVQRAINAFSYNFSNLYEKDTAQLFWTMIGIESLLAEGPNNIIAQIRSKTSLILGEPKEFKKKLNNLYDYRSRLVHGALDFPAKFSSDYDNFESKYWDYSKFGVSILIALVKELIIANEQEFKFEYHLVAPKA